METLRFITAGSVDDGKSTLIGRLLYDSKNLLKDQVAALERSRASGLDGELNLALITDGLRAEREQGITIDVAYKYFSTPNRKFIIADTPGHEQYTRNMVTGASTADLAILLIDAGKGLTEQTHRHTYLTSLLRIPHVVLAVNKMDAVGYSKEVFDRICLDFRSVTGDSRFKSITEIPLSALRGDNVVERSSNMLWYDGPALMKFLEEVEISSGDDSGMARLPVQIVIHNGLGDKADYRGYAGEVISGEFKSGDAVIIQPSGISTAIAGINHLGIAVEKASPPMSVALRLTDEVDVGRGEIISSANHPAKVAREFRARICWMDERPLSAGTRFLVRHTTASIKSIVSAIENVVNIRTFEDEPGPANLELNEIGVVRIKTARSLVFDSYQESRSMGSFILVDETTNGTVAAGMII